MVSHRAEEILTGIVCQRWNNEGNLCQGISIIQNLLLPIEHRTSCVLKGCSFLYNKRKQTKLLKIKSLVMDTKHAGLQLLHIARIPTKLHLLCGTIIRPEVKFSNK